MVNQPLPGMVRIQFDSPLSGDVQVPVRVLEREIVDVGRAGFRHAHAVQAEQDGERGVGVVVVLGGEQEPGQLASVHTSSLGSLDLGTADVQRWVRRDTTVEMSEEVVATHRGQPPIDR